jgi:hypothetical protein
MGKVRLKVAHRLNQLEHRFSNGRGNLLTKAPAMVAPPTFWGFYRRQEPLRKIIVLMIPELVF